MKWVRTAIGAVIAISVIPAIILTVINVTELKDVKNVQFELLSEEGGNFFITSGTYDKLIEHKNIINYDIESNYPLITHEELDRATWRLSDVVYNEIIDRDTNPRIVERVGKVVFDGSENWQEYSAGLFYVLNEIENFPFVTNVVRDDFVSNLYENTRQYRILNDIEEDKVIAINDTGLYSLPSVFVRDNQFNTVNDFKQFLSQNPLTVYYELAVKNPIEVDGELVEGEPRLAEQYDFSKFKLTYDKNRIRVIFDIDESYYLWEITNDDRLIPINGQHEVGNTWTVKFYVYEIQQPLIRSLVLLIPLIVISGLLYYLYIVVSKRE